MNDENDDLERLLISNSSSSSSSSNVRQRDEDEVDPNEEAAKRMRMMEDLVFNEDDDDDLDDGAFHPMDDNDLLVEQYEDCVFCDFINKGSLRDNEVFLDLMRLYTDNASGTYREASYKHIKEFWDTNCSEHTGREVTMEQIRDHFEKHTQYPTDEILRQLRIYKNIRNNFLKTVLSKRKNSKGKEEIQGHVNNIKVLIQIQKEIRDLLSSIKDIPSMAGYSNELNF
jgi:hypothetical protein